jgi:hypothetical protein
MALQLASDLANRRFSDALLREDGVAVWFLTQSRRDDRKNNGWSHCFPCYQSEQQDQQQQYQMTNLIYHARKIGSM